MPIEFHRDGPWELPEGWVWARAGDILPLEYGKGLPERVRDSSGEIPVYGSAGVVGTHSTSLVAEPCLIVARKGSVGAVFEEVGSSWPIDTVYFARESPVLDRRYAYWFLSFERLDRLDQSTAVPSLSRDKYNDVLFPIAPLPEQRRMAARIDELFTEIADGETALARARADLNTWRRALLKAAVTGELTREWREHNSLEKTGEELVARACEERARAATKTRAGHTAEVRDDVPELSFDELPETWTSATFGELFNLYTGSTPSRSKPDYWGGDIPWVSSGEVAFCRITDTKEKITEAGLTASSTRLHPVGTVLLAMIGEGKTRGQPAILDIPAGNNQNAAAIRVSETSILPEFVFYFLAYRYEKTRRAGQGGNQPALNLGKVSQIRMPVPPLVEMLEIVRLVKELLVEMEDVGAAPQRATIDAIKLRQSVLKAAFEGRLVEQDPRDEPVDLLLMRLREQVNELAVTPRRTIRARRAARG
jgi:type I restriction enzyme S subunit